jgi:hypothetical protein
MGPEKLVISIDISLLKVSQQLIRPPAAGFGSNPVLPIQQDANALS